MTLFGDLQHHAIADLLKVLKTQNGTLYLHQAYQGRTLELTLSSGSLQALYIDGFPVRDESEARTVLSQLPARGAFEFQKQAATTDPGFYTVNLQALLASPAQVVPDERLPHAETRFQVSASDMPVPADLHRDWLALAPYLSTASSAAELARLTGRSVPGVQQTLHHLRAAGLITPHRASQGVQSTVAPAGSGLTPPVSPPLVQRLLGALRRFGRRGLA